MGSEMCIRDSCDVKQIQARRASECISSGGDDALACASSLSKERSTIVKHATRILCVWLPNWPIQRLVVQRPELRRQQVLLFRRDSRRGNLVNAASPLARQAGCRVGMPLSEAKSLLRRSQAEQTFFFEHDLKQDVQAIEQLCQSLDGFSPTVGLELIDDRDFKQGKRPAAILLDVTGLAHLFGDENHLARLLMKHLEADGYLGRVAIANTVGAAWAAAHFLASRYFREHQQPLVCLLYTSPSPRDLSTSRMPSSA